MTVDEALAGLLLYLLFPLWLLAGAADWLCHRLSRIELTSGPRESWLHLLMFLEIAAGVGLGLFLETTALVLVLLGALFLLHQASSLWDTSYSAPRRRIAPLEQQVHGFLELVPLMAILSLALLSTDQLTGLFHPGAPADVGWRLRDPPVARVYVVLVGTGFAVTLLFTLEELWRTQRAMVRARTLS